MKDHRVGNATGHRRKHVYFSEKTVKQVLNLRPGETAPAWLTRPAAVRRLTLSSVIGGAFMRSLVHSTTIFQQAGSPHF